MAVLATALSFESAIAARPDTTAVPARPRPRRMVCRWIIDPVRGRLVCAWEPDERPRRRPILHLKLVRA